MMSPKCPTMSPQQEAMASSTSYLILGLKEFTKVVKSPNQPSQLYQKLLPSSAQNYMICSTPLHYRAR